MFDVVGIAADGSTVTSSEIAIPYMNVLCIIVANHVIISITDIAVVDVDVWSPDGNTIRIMRSFSFSYF